MKKYISFLILFLPWLLTIFIIPFNNAINNLLTIYILISFVFYFFISLFLYSAIEDNIYNKDFILAITLLYIFTQYFNASLFYFRNYIISLVLSIFILSTFIFLLHTYVKLIKDN